MPATRLSAEAAYRNAIVFAPETNDWKLGLARSLLEQQKFDESIAILDYLIKLKPEDPALWLVQANAYLGNGDATKAAANYEIVTRIGQSHRRQPEPARRYLHEREHEGARPGGLSRCPRPRSDQTIRPAPPRGRDLTNRGALDEAKLMIDQIRATYSDIDNDVDLVLLKLRPGMTSERIETRDAIKVLEQIVEREPRRRSAHPPRPLLFPDSRSTILSERKTEAKAALIYERACKNPRI